jgi:K+-sensing histidine kinase KdpD
VVVEDGGPGLSGDALATLFDSSTRPSRQGAGSRRGSGTGLMVVSGFAGAMEIELAASVSDLGGLAITLGIPAEPAP